ncbi:hypothetical protein GIB67_015572, partial [Kingdonia uniflora]
ENIPLEEVFESLKCTREGLSFDSVQERLELFGYNKLEEKKESKILKFLGFMWNPLSWVMEAAAIMAIALTQPGGKEPDYHDFIGILVLLIINSTISFIEENNAGNAAAALMARLAPKAKSALTGESLPVTKHPGDGVYSGSTCKQGEIEAIVIATGVHTFFGKAAHLVESTTHIGHFQQAREGIKEVHFLPFNPTDKRTALTYTDKAGKMHRVSKGAPEQILDLAWNRSKIERRVHSIIDKFAERGLRSLAVAHQEVPAGTKDSSGDPWEFVGLLPLFDPPRHDSAETIRRALDLGVSVKMITGSTSLIRYFFHLQFEYISSQKEEEDLYEVASQCCNLNQSIYSNRLVNLSNVNSNATFPDHSKLFLLEIICYGYYSLLQLSNMASEQDLQGDQLAIGKETGRRLGMGTNMYPSSALLGEHKDESVSTLPIDELIEKADGFAGVFPEHKYEIVKRLQARKHICGMTGDGVNDAPALKKADIGIAVADATDAARSASDIVLTEPGLSVIISAVLTSRAIFQRMKNYTIYAVSITIRIVLGFMLLTIFWKFDFPPFMVLVIAILNDGTIMTISKDRVKPSQFPDSWKLSEIFATGIVIGTYLALTTVIFFWATYETNFFANLFNLTNFNKHKYDMNNPKVSGPLNEMMASAVYLQVSTISQALIFVTRSTGWSFFERPGFLLVVAFIIAQLIATAISATVTSKFAGIRKIGWGWTGVIWIFNIATYLLLDLIKFAVRYALSGNAWGLVMNQRTAFTNQKEFGKEAREVAWVSEQRILHGLHSMDKNAFTERHTFGDINNMAEEARKRAEIARLRELHTLKGKVESFAKLRGFDIDNMNNNYTV